MSALYFSLLPPLRSRGATHRETFASRLSQAVAAEWRNRRAARQVDSLSDEMLHDIGITRGEIDNAVRFGRARRAR